MATYICIGRESFTFNPHTLWGLVGKATDSAVCFPWLHLNSPDQPSYPSIFPEWTQARPGRHAMCSDLQWYADRQLAARSLHPRPISLKSFPKINLMPTVLAATAYPACNQLSLKSIKYYIWALVRNLNMPSEYYVPILLKHDISEDAVSSTCIWNDQWGEAFLTQEILKSAVIYGRFGDFEFFRWTEGLNVPLCLRKFSYFLS